MTMPLVHADLISNTTQPYFGMRSPVRAARGEETAARPKYTLPQLRVAIGRAPQTWAVWRAYQTPKRATYKGSPVTKGTPSRPMPGYLSAYMMLLDGVHPTHELVGFGPARRVTQFPAIPRATDKCVAEWRELHGVTYSDVSDAFDYQKDTRNDMFSESYVQRKRAKLWADGDNDPNIRQHSVRRIGADGVRWLMLQLMADAHPTMQLSRRAAPIPEIIAPPAHDIYISTSPRVTLE